MIWHDSVLFAIFALVMNTTHKDFLKRSITAGFGMFIVPTIVPASVFGSNAPSNRWFPSPWFTRD